MKRKSECVVCIVCASVCVCVSVCVFVCLVCTSDGLVVVTA